MLDKQEHLVLLELQVNLEIMVSPVRQVQEEPKEPLGPQEP